MKSLYKLSQKDVEQLWRQAFIASGVNSSYPFGEEGLRIVKREFIRVALSFPYRATIKDLAFHLQMSDSSVAFHITTIVKETREEYERAEKWQFQTKRSFVPPPID